MPKMKSRSILDVFENKIMLVSNLRPSRYSKVTNPSSFMVQVKGHKLAAHSQIRPAEMFCLAHPVFKNF